MHKTLCFTHEMQHEPLYFVMEIPDELVQHRRATFLQFHSRKAARTLHFLNEIAWVPGCESVAESTDRYRDRILDTGVKQDY